MSQRKGAGSKFGHLFGDTSDSSSGSSKSSRLSISADLYKDPLAAFIPPITATTTTTTTARGGASAVKATLSSPTTSSSSAVAAVAGSKTPPGSSSTSSRSSTRLQHHALFSSLTDSSGSSFFDSTPQLASAALSAAKRDLLFGDSNGPTSSSSSRRTSTPPLSRNNTSNNNISSSTSSSRMSTPPLSTRISTTALDADASPLGESSNSQQTAKDDDLLSVKSPLTTEPLTRTNSQASTRSHESARSSKSVLSQEPDDTQSLVNSAKSGISSSKKMPTALSTSSAPLAVSSSKEATQLSTSSSPLSPKSSFSARAISSRKTSAGSSSRQQNTPSAAAVIANPIFNPLDQPESASSETRSSKDRMTYTGSSATSSQSIETFQSISRTSSPSITSPPPPPLSKNGFERDFFESTSPTPSTNSTVKSAAVDLVIPDDAAEAFANDLLFTSGSTIPQTGNAFRSSGGGSFLDSGVGSHTHTLQHSISDIVTTTATGSATTKRGLGANASVGQSQRRSGFSLGEDVADSSNPWMNTLADSLEETKLRSEDGRSKKIDYTQSDDFMDGPNFAPEPAFTFPSSSRVATTSTTTTTTTITSTLAQIPTLDDDIGGFGDMFSNMQPKPDLVPTSGLSSIPSAIASASIGVGASVSSWNVLDAAEAAAMDPDFQGPGSIVNQSTDKVLAIMQMPKDALDKDISAQEVFDNPWE
ncbi:hypothetical protein BGX28_006327 [Mortierella sp. GBA30]|nr:hypothetical protein BGX28_006327 [Mortierella sp. GBA30]